MKIPGKLQFIITLLLGTVNLLFFFTRDSGFGYVKYSGTEELYPPDPGKSFFDKWSRVNQNFSRKELKEGLYLLHQFTGIDTMNADENKAVSIAAWLAKSFQRQVGVPADSVKRLSPLLQYNSLVVDKIGQLDCGQFQKMFGFFCTAAGLKNRYVEAVPGSATYSGYHEINEVYLSKIKKWAMIDVTRNFLLISKNNQVLSAAEYMQYRLQEEPGTFFITRFDTASRKEQNVLANSLPDDEYFNKNYALRYYLNTNLTEVYSLAQKIKRYVFGEPWYEMFKPGNRHTNFLFRIRQFFIFGFGVFTILMILYHVRSKK